MLTRRRLKEVLRYNPLTGVFIRRVHQIHSLVGQPAGCFNNEGYLVICIDRIRYKGHQLAWFYMTGRWPRKQIDHKNRRQGDNRFRNLRPASNAQNVINGKRRKDNKSGHKGVAWHNVKKKWIVQIQIDGKQKCIGTVSSLSKAVAIRRYAVKRYYGEFGNL